MGKALQIPGSTYYYESKQRPDNSILNAETRKIFRQSRNIYGARKIKAELAKKKLNVPRRRIGRIMKEEGMESSYTVAQYKTHADKCNESKVENIVKRNFQGQPQYHVVVSDLTYVGAGLNWHYICVLAGLFNREIIGYSAGKNKDAELVSRALSRADADLGKIQIFQTDQGNEFNNRLLGETLEAFHIRRSLGMKGCPYDNAVAEAAFKIIRTEFVKGQTYENLGQLQSELLDYVNRFANHRIHSSLGYLTPKEYRLTILEKVVEKLSKKC